jgi:hypothetical protein
MSLEVVIPPAVVPTPSAASLYYALFHNCLTWQIHAAIQRNVRRSIGPRSIGVKHGCDCDIHFRQTLSLDWRDRLLDVSWDRGAVIPALKFSCSAASNIAGTSEAPCIRAAQVNTRANTTQLDRFRGFSRDPNIYISRPRSMHCFFRLHRGFVSSCCSSNNNRNGGTLSARGRFGGLKKTKSLRHRLWQQLALQPTPQQQQ